MSQEPRGNTLFNATGLVLGVGLAKEASTYISGAKSFDFLSSSLACIVLHCLYIDLLHPVIVLPFLSDLLLL